MAPSFSDSAPILVALGVVTGAGLILAVALSSFERGDEAPQFGEWPEEDGGGDAQTLRRPNPLP